MEQTRAVQPYGTKKIACTSSISVLVGTSHLGERAKEILDLESSYSEWRWIRCASLMGMRMTKHRSLQTYAATTLIRLIRSLRWRTADSRPPESARSGA